MYFRSESRIRKNVSKPPYDPFYHRRHFFALQQFTQFDFIQNKKASFLKDAFFLIDLIFHQRYPIRDALGV